MSSLDRIGVRVEPGAGDDPATGNLLPILHQIRHALARLAADGEPSAIDLAAIPFAPGEMDRLLETLGEGEVDATIDALGETRVFETAISGVWIVRHFAPNGHDFGTLIEITRMPALLQTPQDDVRDSLAKLGAQLESTNPGQHPGDITRAQPHQE